MNMGRQDLSKARLRLLFELEENLLAGVFCTTMHIAWPLTEAHLCLERSLVNGSSSPFLSRAACKNFSFIVHDGIRNAKQDDNYGASNIVLSCPGR
jgi:hypothetical protein